MRLATLVAALIATGCGLCASVTDADDVPQARLAYVHGSQLWTMDASGEDRRRVLPGTASEPAWSPDGSLIAFARARSYTHGDLWVSAPDGSDAYVLVEGHGDLLAAPAWSPDGARLAFVRYTPSRGTIEVVDRNGKGAVAVTHVSDRKDFNAYLETPVWTPDGRSLLYTRHASAGKRVGATIRQIDLDGRNDRILLRDASGGAFSPDGQTLAFSDKSAHDALDCPDEDPCRWKGDPGVAAADGSGRHILTRTKGEEATFSWSPDGSRIAFASDRNRPEEARPEIYTVAPDGSCLTWITNGNVVSDAPSWSPAPGAAAPATCDVSRAPLLERLPSDEDLLWAGPVFDGTLFSGTAHALDGITGLFYEDCAAFAPTECKQEFQVAERDTCRTPKAVRYYLRQRTRIRKVGDALVVRWAGTVDVIFAGHSVLELIDEYLPPEPGRVVRLARALRPVSGDPTPALAMGAPLRKALPARLRGDVGRCAPSP